MRDIEKKPLTYDLIKFIVYIVSLAIGVMLFYGAIDKRVTIIETELKYKVDEKALFDKLDKFKEDLENKIEVEIKKIKN